MTEVGRKIQGRDLEIHPLGWVRVVKAMQGEMYPPPYNNSSAERGLWGKAALKPAMSELTLRKSH